ncbi:hypothetical protein CRG98_046766 [Punica granatum]|uniref:Uncharacterized protein n=1 Tax=Punica granatum TaxID=22663 RepID=A0A2I0HN17_PUNGR|nr:hypothetical protein CRG98_046766 [Punica granatum]
MPSRSKGPPRPTLSPVKRWSRSESPTTVHNLRSTSFLLSGLGTFRVVYERLGPPLRSPRSPTLHRAVVGAIVPTPFSPSCHSRCLSGTYCPWCPAGSPDPLATSPTLSLVHRG